MAFRRRLVGWGDGCGSKETTPRVGLEDHTSAGKAATEFFDNLSRDDTGGAYKKG
jgi:hypothetical protein